MITNNFDLPQPFVNAAAIDDYDRGTCDISTTELIDPPLMVWLKRAKKDEIIEDASDMLWITLGKAWHSILEDGCPPEDICEKRFYAEAQGWKVGSRIDYYSKERQRLEDWKLTSAWTTLKQRQKDHWTAQLNVEAWNLRENGIPVRSAWVTAGLRDWSQKRKLDSSNYPERNIVQIQLPLWSEADAKSYVEGRVWLHQTQWKEIKRYHAEPRESLFCSDEARWKDPNKYAVMLPGRKSAVALHDIEADAETHKKVLGPKATVEKRIGQSVRCQRFCQVRSVCAARGRIAQEEGWDGNDQARG